MLIHVGLFDMVLTEVSGGGGSFSGKGYLGFPYLIALARGANYVKEAASPDGNSDPKCNGCFAVVFNNIGIDNERHLASGEVHVVTTGFKAFVEKEMEKQDSVNKAKGTKPKGDVDLTSNLKEYTSKVDIEIAKPEDIVMDKETGKLTLKDPKGKTIQITPKKDKDGNTYVEDKNGSQYKVDKDGNVSKVEKGGINAFSPKENEKITYPIS